MGNHENEDKVVGIVLGYYEIHRDWDGNSIARWRHNPNLEMDAGEQLEHNRKIDPGFLIVRITPPAYSLVAE